MKPGWTNGLTTDELTYHCSPERFSFTTTAELEAGTGTIGQERGVASLEFGLAVRTIGFNIFVAGVPGTGRNTTTLDLIRARATNEPVPPDWCYVYNFSDPSRPRAISLRAGQGRVFAAEMNDLIAACQREIRRAFESEDYAQQRTAIAQQLQAARELALEELRGQAQALGFAIEAGESGIISVPLDQGRPVTREEFEALAEARRTEIQQNHQRLQPLISQILVQHRRLEKAANDRLRTLDQEIANVVLAPLLNELREHYSDQPRVLSYLEQVQHDLLQNLNPLRGAAPEGESIPSAAYSAGDDLVSRYRVNVVVDNGYLDGAPIVVEQNPTYYNLFGRTDYAIRQGAPVTDFRMIRAGAVHRANGGYLVLQARDVLTAPFAWDGLKRTLRSRAVQPENLGDQQSAIPTVTLRPEPIPVDLKVVLVGDAMLYRTLRAFDDDFQKYFKVRADFDVTMPRTPDHETAYAAFIARRCHTLELRHFDRAAVARVVDFGARLAGDRNKLSTCFVDIANLVDEASYWAGVAGSDVVRVDDVTRAIEEKVYRSRMIEEKLQEYLTDGTILVDVAGAVVGQVNGLSVLDMGDYSFGRPNRITARVGPGNRGIVNIEREIKRSGPAHSKGVMTLSGYLLGQYGREKPLNLTASLGFEQMYEEIDGDSASSTELYALLSVLADLPIRQGIAVTGSVNQRGQVQAIGGVNEKIEGFFAVCKSIGLTGEQGVLIPTTNVRHLLLRDEVISAVREGAFHVWAVSTIDEGIELLTGVQAGTMNEEGSYPSDSIHGRVAMHLAAFAERQNQRETSK